MSKRIEAITLAIVMGLMIIILFTLIYLNTYDYKHRFWKSIGHIHYWNNNNKYNFKSHPM